jgi:hypothetical protein
MHVPTPVGYGTGSIRRPVMLWGKVNTKLKFQDKVPNPNFSTTMGISYLSPFSMFPFLSVFVGQNIKQLIKSLQQQAPHWSGNGQACSCNLISQSINLFSGYDTKAMIDLFFRVGGMGNYFFFFNI